MAEPKDLIVPMLKEMRAENRDQFANIDKRFDKVDKRLDTIEGRQKSFNNALTADTMMTKFVAGDFEGQIEALEKQVADLMKSRS